MEHIKPKQFNYNRHLSIFLIIIGLILISGCLIFSPIITTDSSISPTGLKEYSKENDGKLVSIKGQIITTADKETYLIDGYSQVKIEGSQLTLDDDFYEINGIYNANSNSITFQNGNKLSVNPYSIDDAKSIPDSFAVVEVQGLLAPPPACLDPSNIHQYILYNNEGLYLILSQLPDTKSKFSEVSIIGTLFKGSIIELNLPNDISSINFRGVIFANEISYTPPITTTVKEINSNPEKFYFKRVLIDGIYSVASGKLGYKVKIFLCDPRIHLGLGIMGDEFLPDDKTKMIVAIDPVNIDWQIRKGKITGTVLKPTREILLYFAQKELSQLEEEKPILLVEDSVDNVLPISIEDLINDLTENNGGTYDGKVVKLTGYAIGCNVPVKEIAEKITESSDQGLGLIVKHIPVDVNIRGTAIADKLKPKSQIVLAGLNSELIGGTECELGKFDFKVVITKIDNNPYLFLINKSKLPSEFSDITPPIPTKTQEIIPTFTISATKIPTLTPTQGFIYIWSQPSGGWVYVDGIYKGITSSQYLVISAPQGSHTIKISKMGYVDYSKSVFITAGSYSTVDAYLTAEATLVTIPTATFTPTQGSIYIWSQPSGGWVYVDGIYKGITSSQYLVISAPPGSHTIKISKIGYGDYSKSVFITAGSSSTVDAYLTAEATPIPTPSSTPTPSQGYLKILSIPSEGSVYVDGIFQGTTSSQYLVIALSPGSHTVTVSKPGYEDYSESVLITAGSYSTVNAYPLIPSQGSIAIWSQPSGGSVYIDEIFQGITSSQYLVISVSPGSHTVTVTKPGYEDYSESVLITAGSYSMVDADLTPSHGTIAIWSQPSGGSVYVDGIFQGTTSSQYLNIPISPRISHTVEIKKLGYRAYSESVSLNGGDFYIVKGFLVADPPPTISI